MSQFEVALLLGMASITFAIRYTLFAVGDRVRFSPLVQQALGYVPVAVLTGICELSLVSGKTILKQILRLDSILVQPAA